MGDSWLSAKYRRTVIMKLFRVAEPASFVRNYAKTLVQTTVMWGIFLVGGPYLVHRIAEALGIWSWSGFRWPAVALFVAGGSLGLRSGWVMARLGEGTPLPLDTARKLVIAGPYRRVRNPMALAGTIQSLATGIFLGSVAVGAATIFSATLWHVWVRPAEEADMLERFGEPFKQYKDSVPLWLPKLG